SGESELKCSAEGRRALSPVKPRASRFLIVGRNHLLRRRIRETFCAVRFQIPERRKRPPLPYVREIGLCTGTATRGPSEAQSAVRRKCAARFRGPPNLKTGRKSDQIDSPGTRSSRGIHRLVIAFPANRR